MIVGLLLVTVAFAALIQSITFDYEIVESKATMTGPISIGLGTIIKDSANDTSAYDSGEDLTVSVMTDIVITMDSPIHFSSFSCNVQLRQGGILQYEATVTEVSLQQSMSNIPADVYDVWVGYSYTDGSSSASGILGVDISYP